MIKIGQSSHKRYSNNILNLQESAPVRKKSGNLLNAPRMCMCSSCPSTSLLTLIYDPAMGPIRVRQQHYISFCNWCPQLQNFTHLDGRVKILQLRWAEIIGACQDNPVRHSTGREKDRQTKKEMGGQHPGVDGPEAEQRSEGVWEPWEMEGAGCQVISGAPTVVQTTGNR